MLFWLSLVLMLLLTGVSILNLTTGVSTHPFYITITNLLLIFSLLTGIILLRHGKYHAAVTINTVFITFRVLAGCMIKYESMINTGTNNNIYFVFGIIGFAALFGNRWLLTATTIFILLFATAMSLAAVALFNPADPNYIIGTMINVDITIIILSTLLFLVSRVTENSLVKTEKELQKNVDLSNYLELQLKEIEQQYNEMEKLNEKIQQTSEKLIKANEDLSIFKRFADASGQGLVISKLNYEIIYANPGFCSIIHAEKPSSITFTSLKQFYHNDNYEHGIDAVFEKLPVAGQWSGEIDLYTCNNEKVPTIQNFFYIHGENRKTLYFAVIVTNISSQKKAEEVLRASEERYRLLVETMNEGLYVLNSDGEIIFVNNSLVTMLGYDNSEMTGRTLTDFLFEERDILDDLVDVNSGSFVTGIDNEVIWLKKDNTIAYTSISPQPVYDDNNNYIGSLGLVTDITERKKAEDEKHAIQSQLHQVQKMEAIGTLAGGIAHDFNNILTAIIGYGEVLKNTLGENNPAVEFVHEILRAAQRSAALTRQLLAFSKKQVLQKEFIDINSIVDNMQNMLSRLIGEGINLVTRLNASEPVLYGDQMQIEQVIMNLSVNSMQAMEDGGMLVIQTDNIDLTEDDRQRNPEIEPGRYIVLTVRDTGAGIKNEILQNIFEPFFTSRENGRGTGLGLAVVYGIVKQHNGIITVKSEVNKGTEFYIYLKSEDLSIIRKERKQKKLMKRDSGNGLKVLVVEDQDEVRSMVSHVLASHGFTVYTSESVESASNLADSLGYAIDLVFCDVILPDGNGLDLVEILKKRNKKIRVLMSSGYTNEKSHLETIHDRGYPFLQKPYSAERLLSTVSNALN